MRYMIWMTTLLVLAFSAPVQAVELHSLADCSLKVYRDINKTHVWSGNAPEGCGAKVNVEKRPDGVFITAWNSDRTDDGWIRVSFSSGMSFYEVADKKAFEKAGRDILARAARIERCLNSIIRVNDPLECRDDATESYSAGEMLGTEYNRRIWLDDDGRHTVAGYSYGDSRASISPPVDLFSGPALPPGIKLDIWR